jgi:type IV pilus assembly protein PilN
MIRINLLGVARQKARKPITILDAAQRTSLVCGLVIVVAVVGIGAWYLSLASQASRLEDEIATAQKEAARLKVVLDEVKRAEDRRADLKQRVDIIGQLRESQAVPVQLLDHVSRSMPNMLWLTALDQKGDAVIIEGRTTTLISLADFVANLGTNALVRKPIDIVNSEVESSSPKGADAGL